MNSYATVALCSDKTTNTMEYVVSGSSLSFTINNTCGVSNTNLGI